ncbi:peptide ABC transporter substrate-binding protein [Haloferula helveola]|uniref:Peptide ABC transporter substrate-binding protein n=1 Tax=Haloferula helveola TaxID=490095 RepID=A0ABN6GYV0_9BACT|nr:peptide ABC transporter substrate-binding protein [Haloferula helveola]
MPHRLLNALLSAAFLVVASCNKETAVDKANRDGILLMGNSAEPKSLDHQLVTGVPESKIIGALFEGLAGDHPSEDDTMLPGAAASWTHNEGLTEWAFELQPEGRWSDGEDVKASDFVFAYRRLLTPEFAAPYVDMLFPIEHAEEFNKDMRGEILFRISPTPELPWEDCSDVNFHGDGSVDIEDIKDKDWDDLTAEERRLYVRAKGLDPLTKEKLEWIAEDTDDRFVWPDGFGKQSVVMDRMLEFAGKDLWDMAKVGVTAPAKRTLSVKLKEPVPYLPALSRHYTWFPVPEHVVTRFGKLSDRFTDWSDLGNLVGNGPFQLKEWRYHDVIEVEQNPHYWDAGNVGLKGIRFFPIENPFTEARAFMSGQLHSMYSLPTDLIEWSKKNHPQYFRQEPYVATTFIRINNTRPGLSDPRVRRAMSLCINREEVCKYIQEGYTPANSMTPKMGAYEPKTMLSFNPEEGRKLLAEAGYPNGKGFPRYSMLISKPTARAAAEAYQAMWKEHLNIIIDIQSMDWGSYNTAQQNLDFDLSSAGWVGDYLDPTTFLGMWTEGNGNNNTGWGSEEYEALLSDAAKQADPAKRLETLKKAEELLMTEQPILPVSFYARNYLHRPEVKGWHPLLLDNHPYKLLSLEP